MSTENLCSVTEQATVQAMVESINNGMTPQGSTTLLKTEHTHPIRTV